MKICQVFTASGMLVDFDGPITELLPPPKNREVAVATLQEISSAHVPHEISKTTDHLKVIRWIAEFLPERLAMAEQAATEAEVEAAKSAYLTPNFAEFLRWFYKRAPVAVVTNNSSVVVSEMLKRYELSDYVQFIAGRPAEHPELMKPDPHLVYLAAKRLGVTASDCVLIGDSVTDMQAIGLAGGIGIGYQKSKKHGEALAAAGAQVITDDLIEFHS